MRAIILKKKLNGEYLRKCLFLQIKNLKSFETDFY